ncbi:S24 family peptidase [Rugamonas sp.]|uniref:LexA family transcriptional regulator n=1 Tax=Rugamonas sp. TaxID=1926287 RepID=UPI0025E1EBF5|nr:S24 family peptidase [Rugamonas sp.]
MTWHKRLTHARETRGIKKSHFATMVGVKPSSVTDWENGDTKMLAGENLMRVCETLRIAPTWLLEGLGDMDALTGVEDGIALGAMPVVIADDSSEFYQIAKVQLSLRAGITGFKTEPDRRDGGTRGVARSWVDRNGFDPARLLAIEVTGDSMEPRLYQGDLVIINTADTMKKDGEVFAFNYDGEAVVKRLVKERGEWWLFSDNADQSRHRPKSCRENECIIIGRVVKKESDRI